MEFPLAIQRKETGFSQVSVGIYSGMLDLFNMGPKRNIGEN
jgi:hypothetical protein